MDYHLITDEEIAEKAKKLNVEIIRRFSRNGHSYVETHCLTHPNKPNREVELYNFLNRNTTCGCLLQRYTIEDLKNNPKVRQDLEIIGEYKNNSTPIECQCKVCNYKWFVSPNKLTQGRGCPLCHSKKMSSGERYISKILQENKIDFISQKIFPDLKGGNKTRLRFDFFLPDFNLCIEFQGIQHYQPTVFRINRKNKTKEELQEEAKKKFERSQINDKKKEIYCQEKGINLLVVPYYQKEDIEQIILNKINQKKETLTTAGC